MGRKVGFFSLFQLAWDAVKRTLCQVKTLPPHNHSRTCLRWVLKMQHSLGCCEITKAGLKFRHFELCDISVTNILKPFWTTANVSKQLKISQPEASFTQTLLQSLTFSLFFARFWIPEGLWGCVRIFPHNLPGHFVTDLKATIFLQKKIFKEGMQREIGELTFIKKFNSISQTGFNRDLSFLSHYRCISCPSCMLIITAMPL